MFVVLCRKGDRIFSACKPFIKKDIYVTETDHSNQVSVICHSEEIDAGKYINQMFWKSVADGMND